MKTAFHFNKLVGEVSNKRVAMYITPDGNQHNALLIVTSDDWTKTLSSLLLNPYIPLDLCNAFRIIKYNVLIDNHSISLALLWVMWQI